MTNVVAGAIVSSALTISGEVDEVLAAATAHAVAVHQHEDGPELREMVRASLKAEV